MKSATYILNKPPGRGRAVRLYRNLSGQLVVDVEGLPLLDMTFQMPWKAVSYFARLREMAQKDFGATKVDWRDYEDLARHWPSELTPWDMEAE